MNRLRARCRLCGYTLVLYMLLLLLGAMSITWNACALVLYPLVPRSRGRRMGRGVISYCYRFFWALSSLAGLLRVDASCLDGLRGEGCLIVVANHPSMLDALLLVARLPRSACIMKAGLMKNVFLGAGARMARYIRNDSPRGLVRLAVQDLRDGGQLVVFPEGTRTVGREINSFRPGFTLISKLAQAPIQTVFIDTDSPYLRKGWPIWRLPPLPIVFEMRLGQRFFPAEDSHAQLLEIEQYYRARMGPPQPVAACPAPSHPTSS
jgi:1-acyl-sn-glycerol-3-phosphate acyltransferase